MALILTVNAPPQGVDNTQRRQIVNGKITNLPANYTTNGIAINFAALVDWIGGAFLPEGSGVIVGSPRIFSQAGNVGLTYAYDPVHGTLRIAQNGTELGNGVAIPADTIGFEVEFARNY